MLAEVCPAATVTVAGVVTAAALLLAIATSSPPAGAASDSVRATLRTSPGVSRAEVGNVSLRTCALTLALPLTKSAAFAVRVALPAARPFKAACTEVFPAGITTEAGADTTAGLLFCSVTSMPPAPAVTLDWIVAT